MLVPVKNISGQQVGEVDLSDSIFAAPINTAVMHQALVRQLANARLGLHKTKTRSEVAGGGRKPWRQKDTGRARQGSTRAPNWVGGGTVFGPTPRKYTKALPKKMQRSALRSALSAKAGSGQIVVLDGLSFDAPRTKSVTTMLRALGVADQSVLVVLPERDANVQLSARNLPNVKTLLSGYLNIRDLLGHDVVLLSNAALPHIEQWLAVETVDEAVVAEGAEE